LPSLPAKRGVVYPAAGFPRCAKAAGARCIEVNPEANDLSDLYDEAIREATGQALPMVFG
jgi:NAD-dependent deacetylase